MRARSRSWCELAYRCELAHGYDVSLLTVTHTAMVMMLERLSTCHNLDKFVSIATLTNEGMYVAMSVTRVSEGAWTWSSRRM